MKSNTININSSKPMVLISIDEYEYLKSLEDAIKHPERYENNDDPDYPTSEEIVLIFEANKKVKDGDFSGFMNLGDYSKSIKQKKKKIESKEFMISEKKNVYNKTGKKSSKVS